MRILLFAGKGGVGTTTLAAATGVHLARQDRKTLVVSTDPAHSLGDVFGTALQDEPVDVEDQLQGLQINARRLTDHAWETLRGQLRSVLARGDVEALEAEELTVVPAVDELLALTEVQRLVEDGAWENVVVDCGPTAETLRLLALPEAVSGYPHRVDRRACPVDVLQTIDRFTTHLTSLRDFLTRRSVTSMRLVLTPQRLVVAETRRMLTSLALQGIHVDGLVVNGLLPEPGMCWGGAASWLRARRAQQDEVLAELRRSDFTGQMLGSVEQRAHEPVGVRALQELAGELYGDGDPLLGVGQTHPLVEVTEVNGGAEMRIAMPLGSDSTVDLTRVDDDLAVTVDGFRRLVALPESLRPYRPTAAESDARGLVVHWESPS